MKRFSILILLCGLSCLIFSCKTKKVVEEAPMLVEETVQVDTTIIPTFPSEVLYVTVREYESMWDSTKEKYKTPEAEYIRNNNVSLKKYMEHRLISFFPDLAYVGLIDKIENRAQSLIPEMSKRAPSFRSQDGYYMPSFAEKVNLERLSDEYEIKNLYLTDSELKLFRELNSLADTAGFVKLKQVTSIEVKDSVWNVDKTLSEDSVPYFMRESMLVSLLTSGLASNVFFRVMQSKARASYVSEFFFPSQTKDGRIGDAYKHLYVNTMLRNYVGVPLAWLIMDVYWENAGSNAPCDMVMDLHNNHVGRNSRYRDLRGVEHSNWVDWAYNVKSFVGDTVRNAQYQNWNKEIPLFVVKEEAAKSDDRLYLYWNKELLEENVENLVE